MLAKTHFALTIFFILLFLNSIENKLIFVIIALIATIIPDIDHSDSKLGKHLVFRPFQFFVKHRGIMHSILICLLISLSLAIFLPIISFGFFLGYSVHLLGDSFTKEGINVFWPLKHRSHGFIKTGGISETLLFYSLIFINTSILLFYTFKILF